MCFDWIAGKLKQRSSVQPVDIATALNKPTRSNFRIFQTETGTVAVMKVAHVETDVAGRGIAETEEGRVLVVFASYTLAVPYVYYYTRGCPPVYAR